MSQYRVTVFHKGLLNRKKKKKTAPEMLQCTVGHTVYRKG